MNSGEPRLRTRRLLLRRWLPGDGEPFAALNADPAVMEHFPAPLTASETERFVESIEQKFERYGYGLWAVEVVSTTEFIGFVGLNPVPFDAHFTPAVEIGWRLARAAWGHGYATEAATAAADFGFGEADLDEIVSFTSTTNLRSQAVMRRIGMTHDPGDDFDHPALGDNPRLRRHVLYRLTAKDWAQRPRV